MKISNKLILGATIVILLNFASCKKYEEGPAFSLKSKTNRLTGTEWESTDIDIDDKSNDSFLELWNELYDDGEFDWTFMEIFDADVSLEFEKDGDFDIEIEGDYLFEYDFEYNGSTYHYEYDIHLEMEGDGDWEWSADKSEISLEFDKDKMKMVTLIDGERDSYNVNAEEMDLEIIRLTSKELKFEDSDGNVWEFEAK